MSRKINQDTKETTGFTDVAGINDNWVLDSYGYGPLDKDKKGNSALYFNFVNGPISVRIAEYDIDPKKVAEFNEKYPRKTPVSNEKAYEDAISQQDANLVQIARVYIPKDEVAIEGETFEDLAKNYVKLLDEKGKNKDAKVRLKIIYNKNGYLEVSTKNGRFINLASEPIGDMKLTDWEKERTTKNTPDSNSDVASASETKRKGAF